MKDKNLLDDIKTKSLNELTELANNIIEKLETEKDLEASIQRENDDIENTLNYVNTNVQNLLYILETNKFIEKDADMKYHLTRKGDIASHVHEIHCLLIGDLYEEGYFEHMTTADLVGFFSCFCNLRVTDDYKEFDCPLNPKHQYYIFYHSILLVFLIV